MKQENGKCNLNLYSGGNSNIVDSRKEAFSNSKIPEGTIKLE